MADIPIVAGSVAFPGHNGDLISGYLARPAGDGPYPGVALIHGIFGIGADIRRWTEELAARGYLALATDLHHREGPGEPDDVTAAVRAMGGVPDARAVGDMDGTFNYIRSLPQHSGKLGLIGFCAGGRFAYLTACTLGGLDAVVDCWGGGVVATPDQLTETRPVAPLDLTPQLTAPLLGLFGEDDRSPSPAHVARQEEELKKLGKVYEFHSYPGVGHHFFANREPAGLAAAADGWQRVYAWFGKYLA